MTHPTTPATAEPTTPTPCGAQPFEGQTRIEIYTDGSCIGNPGPGGWGSVILRNDASGNIIKRLEKSGHALDTTNIRMEMTGACVALESLGRATTEPITLRCDANLIPNAMNTWLAGWKAKDWKKGDGKPVVNRDLWERLERAAEGRTVTWAWVRGHNGAEHNERADRLAYAASRKAEKIVMGR
jgi:ribonuclease HI